LETRHTCKTKQNRIDRTPEYGFFLLPTNVFSGGGKHPVFAPLLLAFLQIVDDAHLGMSNKSYL